MFKAQNAFEGVMANYPSRLVAWLLRRIVFPLGRPYVVPSDRLGHDVASLLIEPSATRDRLTSGMFIAAAPDDPVRLIEAALVAVVAADAIDAKIRAAVKAGALTGATAQARIEQALATGLINAADAETLDRARELTDKVVRVDDFAPTSVAAENVVTPASFARAA